MLRVPWVTCGPSLRGSGLSFRKVPKTCLSRQGAETPEQGKDSLLTNEPGTSGGTKLVPCPQHMQKVTQPGSKTDLDKTIDILEKNITVSLCDLGLGGAF